jgi:hypothetical protein
MENILRAVLGDSYDEVAAMINTYNKEHPGKEVNIVEGELETDYKGKIYEYAQEIERLKAENLNNERKRTLIDAFRSAGVRDPEYAIFKRGGVESFSFDSKGRVLGLNEAVRELKADKSLEHLFEPIRAEYNPVGGDGGGRNPFAKGSINLTEQGKIYKENPAQARAMAAAANTYLQ